MGNSNKGEEWDDWSHWEELKDTLKEVESKLVDTGGKKKRWEGKEPNRKVKDQTGLHSLTAGPSRKEGGCGPQRENKVVSKY